MTSDITPRTRARKPVHYVLPGAAIATPVGVTPQKRQEVATMTDNQYTLPAKFRAMERRGEVQEIGTRKVNPRTGYMTISYRRLKPARSPWVGRLTNAGVIALTLLTAVTAFKLAMDAVLEVLPALLMVAGAAVLIWAGMSMSRGHACKGMHCGGCRR